MREVQRIKGTLSMLLRDAKGVIVDARRVNNLITDAGRNLMARYLVGGAAGTPALSIAVGEGTTAPASADVILQSERQRAPATLTEVFDNHVAKVSAELEAVGEEGDSPMALTEAGILVELPNEEAVLYNRVTFDVVNKGPTMSLTLTWEVSF